MGPATADIASAIAATGGKSISLHHFPHIDRRRWTGRRSWVPPCHRAGSHPHPCPQTSADAWSSLTHLPTGTGPTPAATQVGPLVRRRQRKPLLFQPGKKRIVVCAVIDADLKALFRPLNAGRLMQGKTAAVTPGKITKFLQPVRVGGQLGSSILTGSQQSSSSSRPTSMGPMAACRTGAILSRIISSGFCGSISHSRNRYSNSSRLS